MIDSWPDLRCLQGGPFVGAPEAINTHHADGLVGGAIMELELDLSNLVSSFEEGFVVDKTSLMITNCLRLSISSAAQQS